MSNGFGEWLRKYISCSDRRAQRLKKGAQLVENEQIAPVFYLSGETCKAIFSPSIPFKMVKRSPDQFVVEFLPFALKTQAATGISAIAILSQAALESGWAERAVGNMFFGIKDTDGKNGNEQLVATTEYLAKPDQHRLFPEVISVDWVPSVKKYKYRVRDWFRKYDSPEGSFIDHAQFFLRNPRYSKAVAVGRDHQLFFREIAAAGYATGPAYFETLLAVSRMIEKRMPKTGPAGGSQLESFEFEPDLELPDADEIRLLVPVRRAV